MSCCKFYRVVSRDSLKVSRRGTDFKPVETVNIPPFLAGPVMTGIGGCTLDHIYRDGLGLEYFCDLNELLAVKYENEYRAMKAGENKGKNGNRT